MARTTYAGLALAKIDAAATVEIYHTLYSLMALNPDDKPPLDGTTIDRTEEKRQVTVRVWDERGKIDINVGNTELISKLLQQAGAIPEEAEIFIAQLSDYRDQDHDRTLQGAEDPEYDAGNGLFQAKDGQFESLAELQHLPIAASLPIEKVSEFLTVYSRSTRISPNTAAREILALTNIHVPEDRRNRLSRIAGIFTIEVTISVTNGPQVSRQAVVQMSNRGGQPFRFLAWQPGRGGVNPVLEEQETKTD